ncbi:glutathione peroxidase [Parasediminibacterium sp. JCM 36343]|uniref:glutathione peroxidase n=1 Tax=Parasediminibacterium sp. JCM 36343 TaxID=3374279 RepID=UPI00397CC591
MTIKQVILKQVYHVLMLMAKIFPAWGLALPNSGNVKPIDSLYALQVNDNHKQPFSFAQYKGKKILLVNTASNCGYTAQYNELESLYKQYKDKLVVIGFPANDFQGQEPGSDTAIAQFCKLNYGVSFPLMAKSIVIKGNGQNSVYQWLTDPAKNGWCSQPPVWNFCKYLIDENGVLTHFFNQNISPLDKRVVAAVNAPAK